MIKADVISDAREKLQKFLGFSFPLPIVIEISTPYHAYYKSGIIFVGYFDEEYTYELERTIIHEMVHYVQDAICRPKFPYLHVIIESIPLAFGIGNGKLLRYLRFVEGFATWVDEEIMGYRGDDYWFSSPKYYFRVYYEGAQIFRKIARELGKDKAIEYGLMNKEFCKKPENYESIRKRVIVATS
ncbi:hypothetical protein V6M85_07845 [Sulfolobus tengchongensis]|uniref:Uncharacterized protein n=1 Tax=Sulfolobus tengchongensis TaxID=207809 RepID=A0AAX4L535_9CREN